MEIHKHRFAWRFSGTNIPSDIFYSSPFLTNNTCYIDLIFKTTYAPGHAACSFYLRNHKQLTGNGVHRCSYYLLNEVTGEHHNLVIESTLNTAWLDLGIVDGRVQFLLVVVLDVYASVSSSDSWIEGDTKMIDPKAKRMGISCGHYCTRFGGRDYRLKLNSDGIRDKTALLDGLEQDESVHAKFSVVIGNLLEQKLLTLTLRSDENEFSTLQEDVSVLNIELVTISSDFKKMDKGKISELTKIIVGIDWTLSQEYIDKLKAYNTLQQLQFPDNIPTTPVASTECPINEIIAGSSPQNSISTSHGVATGTALPEKLKLMYKCYTDRKFCDITLQLPDHGHEIRAHKTMLFLGSTVWRQLLTEDDQLSVISVTNFERETIETLVTYIYIDSVPVPPKQTDQLLIAAETYGVDGLKTWCEEQILNTITIDTAVTLLVLAHRYKAKTLFDAVLTYIREHNELKQRDEWKSVFLSYPELALELFRIGL